MAVDTYSMGKVIRNLRTGKVAEQAEKFIRYCDVKYRMLYYAMTQEKPENRISLESAEFVLTQMLENGEKLKWIDKLADEYLKVKAERPNTEEAIQYIKNIPVEELLE